VNAHSSALQRKFRPGGDANTELQRANRESLSKRGFASDDSLLFFTLKAYDALHELNIHLHYLSYPSGVRRLPAGPDDAAE
jgi:hypothetical protein